MSAKIDELLPGFSWRFGPGESGHSFTLTGDGNPHRQFLAIYWRSQAPTVPGWTFFAAKQPSPVIDGQRIRLRGMEFDPLAFWLTPRVDDERERVDLTVWHPSFAEIDERLQWTVIFLYLDEVLGEIGTQTWIGQIEPGEHRLADSIPLRELPSFIEKVAADYGWKKGGPGEVWTSYSIENPAPGALRTDIITGSTCQIVLVAESETGHLEADPLEGTGAEYMYVTLPVSHFARGGEADARQVIEEALDDVLGAIAGGRVIGGAMGLEHVYIDLLLFDGERSREAVRGVLRAAHLPASAQLHYFTRARAAEHVTP